MRQIIHPKGKRILSCFLVAFVAVMNAGASRLTKELTPRELYDKADLVILATAIETFDGDDSMDINLKPHGINGKLKASVTRFEVELLLSGKNQARQVTVMHHSKMIANIVGGVESPPEPLTFQLSTKDKKVVYMLFLCKDSDKLYKLATDYYHQHNSVFVVEKSK